MKQAEVYFDEGIHQLNNFISANGNSRFFFIVDANTHEFCLPYLLQELEEIQDMEIIEIPVGEDAKSPEAAFQVWESLSDLGADRHSVIINCGGGVVTDAGGFTASVYKRGIRFIHVPTSLLAMVDASVGGKTGINLNHVKNQIGTFAQPEMVYVNPAFLDTLPGRELLSGFAEMLKHGLILDKMLWEKLVAIDKITPKNLSPYLSAAIRIKQEVVATDPEEKGYRKILNAGHTLGHALESCFLDQNRPVTHGEAVALGLVLESFIGWRMQLLSQEDFDEIFEGIRKFYPKVNLPGYQTVLPYLQHDKKNINKEIHCSLLSETGICPAETKKIDPVLIEESFHYYVVNY